MILTARKPIPVQPSRIRGAILTGCVAGLLLVIAVCSITP